MSQASPTYTYDLKLSDSLDFRESRPIIGITLEFGGYNLCQIYVDEKVVFVRDKLPIEALKTILSSSGFLEPVYVSPSVKGIVSSELGIEVEMVSSENIEQSESAAFYAAVLRRVARELSLAVEGFREINHSLHELSDSVRTQPLNLFTAQEIGVLPNLNVPSLVSYLLPPSSSASSRKYLKQLLVVPPPHKLAQNFRSILLALSTTANLVTLPKMTPLGIGKIVNLLSTSRCNVASFREIAQNICGVIKLLEINSDIGTMITSNLLQLVEYDSGVVINRSEFYSKLITIDSLISRAITPCTQLKEYKYSQVPHEFFRRNETDFSGMFVNGDS